MALTAPLGRRGIWNRFRPLILATLGVPVLATAFAGFGAVSLLGMLHLPRRAGLDERPSVSIAARDGAVLKASWAQPQMPSGACIMILHGVGDSRRSTKGFSDAFVEDGYSVLAPDSRAHGESGGDMITYGILEQHDTAQWAHWMRDRGCRRIYGLGHSLGGSMLILANAVEPEPLFTAIAADSPFADLLDTAEYRGARILPLPASLAGPLAKLAVTGGGWYTRWWYGLDFDTVSPEAAIARVKTPVLLIHGTRDRNTPPVHSERLAAANPHATELWLVEGARHVGSYRTAPEEYMRRVTEWFARAQ